MKKAIVAAALVVAGVFGLTACANDADVVSDNLSTDADNFKVARKIIAVNGITDTYIMTVEGYCSINDEKTQLEVTCKVNGGYIKNFVGLSDNTFYFVEQLDARQVSANHYKVVFKPSVVVPSFEAR